MPRLLVLIASTRPVRAGKPVGDWFTGVAEAHGGFEVEVADLKELALPFMDEAKHPRFGSTSSTTPRRGRGRWPPPTRSPS